MDKEYYVYLAHVPLLGSQAIQWVGPFDSIDQAEQAQATRWPHLQLCTMWPNLPLSQPENVQSYEEAAKQQDMRT